MDTLGDCIEENLDSPCDIAAEVEAEVLAPVVYTLDSAMHLSNN